NAGALLAALLRTQHVYLGRLESALESKGLSVAKFGALQVLAEAEEPMPLGQLAERLSCVRSNITQLVDRLEAEGLVHRVPDPADRRSKRAAITPEGRRRFEAGWKVKQEIERSLFTGLSAAEAEQLAATLNKMSGDATG